MRTATLHPVLIAISMASLGLQDTARAAAADPVKAATKAFEKGLKADLKTVQAALNAEYHVLDQQLDLLEFDLKSGNNPSPQDLADHLVDFQVAMHERFYDAVNGLTARTSDLHVALTAAGLAPVDFPNAARDGVKCMRDKYLPDAQKRVQKIIDKALARAHKCAQQFLKHQDVRISVALGPVHPAFVAVIFPMGNGGYFVSPNFLTIDVAVAWRHVSSPAATVRCAGYSTTGLALSFKLTPGNTTAVTQDGSRWSTYAEATSGPAAVTILKPGESMGQIAMPIFVP